jgi:hypothetical protein
VRVETIYSSIGRVSHSLDGDLVGSKGLELSSNLGSNDGAHVTELAGTASENESQLLATGVGGHAVLGASA